MRSDGQEGILVRLGACFQEWREEGSAKNEHLHNLAGNLFSVFPFQNQVIKPIGKVDTGTFQVQGRHMIALGRIQPVCFKNLSVGQGEYFGTDLVGWLGGGIGHIQGGLPVAGIGENRVKVGDGSRRCGIWCG